MRHARTGLFQTVHPMTYLFVVQSATWGFMLLFELLFTVSDVVDVTVMFWPILMAYAWSVLVLIGAGLLLGFLYYDCEDHSRERIWNTAKGNLVLWVFATMLWFIFGEWPLLIISVINIIGFVYIALADKFPGAILRV